jgi:hypothetical protein
MKRLWSGLLAAVIMLTSCAIQGSMLAASENGDVHERVSGDFAYTLNDSGEAIITGYSGDARSLTIPEELDGYPVVEIGSKAFYQCSSMTKVKLPKSIRSVGELAFYRCYNLTGLTLPEGLESIGNAAFYLCVDLTNIKFPKGLRRIGDEAFSHCNSLTDLKLPEGLQEVGYEAFAWCQKLTKVKLPEGLPCVGERAFFNCIKLSSVTLPEGLKRIENEAFAWCSKLGRITLPDSLETMGDNPFINSTAKLSLSPDHPHFVFTDDMLIHKGEKRLVSYLSQDSKIKLCVVPIGTLHIGSKAFSYTDVGAVVLPEGIRSIGDEAFAYCIYLLAVALPDSLEAMSDNPFIYTPAKLSILPDHPHFTLSDGLLFHKEEKRLVSCIYSLQAENYVVPEGTLHIGNKAFRSCSAISTVTLPEGIRSIGDGAFSGCNSLTDIALPEGLQRIGDEAFSYCNSLTDVALPEGLLYIGKEAFCECDGLTGLNIPASVETIGFWAFYGCPVTLSVVPGSPGAAYAEEYERRFVYIEPVATSTPEPAADPTPMPATPEPATPMPEPTATAEPTETPEPAPALDPAAPLKEYQCEGFDYKLNEHGEAVIIRCWDAAGKVTIPAALDGHPVAAIDDWAFYNNNLLTGVTLPEGLRSIGNGAFGRCAKLAGIALPDSLEAMGDNPFLLTKAKLSLSPNHPHFALTDGMLFHKGDMRLICYRPGSKAGTCDVPEGTLQIGAWAFCNVTALRTAVLPEGLQSIEGNAFTWCSGLRSLNLPASVAYIDPTAFTDCQQLTLTVAPDSPGAAFANDNQMPFAYAEQGI